MAWRQFPVIDLASKNAKDAKYFLTQSAQRTQRPSPAARAAHEDVHEDKFENVANVEMLPTPMCQSPIGYWNWLLAILATFDQVIGKESRSQGDCFVNIPSSKTPKLPEAKATTQPPNHLTTQLHGFGPRG